MPLLAVVPLIPLLAVVHQMPLLVVIPWMPLLAVCPRIPLLAVCPRMSLMTVIPRIPLLMVGTCKSLLAVVLVQRRLLWYDVAPRSEMVVRVCGPITRQECVWKKNWANLNRRTSWFTIISWV